jgi:hypothetical protein
MRRSNRDPHQHKSKLSKSRWHPTSQDGAQGSIDAREESQEVFTCRKITHVGGIGEGLPSRD